MSQIDWVILIVTIFSIVIYGIIKNRKDKNIDDYLLGNRSLPWYHICLSTMATQASAITFLSTPGQGFTDGMRFVQFYFGLPLAILVICVFFVPYFRKIKIFTAYEFLENRFDSRVRLFTATLFLLSRGLATGLSIYAPSIVLSTIFGLDINLTNILMGGLVLIYTVLGGTKAISHTHVQQMFFVLIALLCIGFFVYYLLPSQLGFTQALEIAGMSGKMNVIDLKFNPNERYNLWSGLIGGFFLQLSYFGTDQSQVGRYLVGKSSDEIKLGLLGNAFLKIPMQFAILFIGVMVFVFYSFQNSPLIFNKAEEQRLMNSPNQSKYLALQNEFQKVHENKIEIYKSISKNSDHKTFMTTVLNDIDQKEKDLRKEARDLMIFNNPKADGNDTNYVFLRFILDHLPIGIIGFIVAIIFTASMGSVASAFSSLAACTQIDILDKTKFKNISSENQLLLSKALTVFWGIFCILVATFAQKLGNSLIELVNILGSWFYGVILGIFLVAFFLKSITAKYVLIGAVITQVIVILCWYLDLVAYLWLNPIGALGVCLFAYLTQKIFNENTYS